MDKSAKNNLEILLDRPASPSLIRRLVWAGVVPSKKFIGALVLCRDNSLLTRYGMQFLLFSAVAYAVAGFACFLFAKWAVIPFAVKISSALSLIMLFSVLAWFQGLNTRRGVVYLFIACFLVGPLLSFIGNYYQTTDYSWGSFALWAILILPWTIISRSMLLYSFWLILFNAAVLCWGCQIALPSSYIGWPEFFSLLAVGNGFILAAREGVVHILNNNWLKPQITRLLPLIIGLSYAVYPLIGYILGINGSSLIDCALIFFLLVTLASMFYFRVFPDFWALTCVLSSVCVLFLVFWLYAIVMAILPWYILFAAVLVVFGFSSWLIVKLKDVIERRKCSQE
ncbi:MAG: DUF2157 domain-containing protein [Alphaproteobacteria bacterium]|nr:DUF2157 domain-containing protein [Alphaproteobacteria bacterium]